jgi:ribonuclease Z
MHLYGRTQELHLYGIAPLKQLIDLQLEFSGTILMYPLIFHAFETDSPSVIVDDEMMQVTTIPLNHRIPTCGFLVREKQQLRKIRKDFVKSAKIPVPYYERIRKGEDFVDENGKIFFNDDITENPLPAKAYAYCTDTAYYEPVVPIIKNADLLYHEATFMEDKADDAHAKFHSTAREAAMIAMKANVKKLVIGHFSARYSDSDGLLKEAQEVFAETVVGVDGLILEV